MKLSYKLSHLFLCSILIALSSLLTACEKPAADIVHAAKEPQRNEAPVPDLSQICQNLKKEMTTMDAQRTTLAIEQVNQDIRLCVPLRKPAEHTETMRRVQATIKTNVSAIFTFRPNSRATTGF